MVKLIAGILIVSAVATAGDYIWYAFDVRQTILIGVLHGALLLMSVGGALGWPAGRVVVGLEVGVGAGVVGALAYYALLGSVGGTAALLAAWATCWLVLAIGEGRWMQRTRRSWSEILSRGLIAAAVSGVTFYAISGTIWGRAPAGGRNYLQHFVAWIVAWAPGLLAIGLPTRRSASKG
jgi:hypothetical protein